MPNRNARKEILQIHTRSMPLAKDIKLDDYAESTVGYTGADLEMLAKESAMRALREIMPDLKNKMENFQKKF
jgi:transitional endoplasmic reticulum ATPase